MNKSRLRHQRYAAWPDHVACRLGGGEPIVRLNAGLVTFRVNAPDPLAKNWNSALAFGPVAWNNPLAHPYLPDVHQWVRGKPDYGRGRGKHWYHCNVFSVILMDFPDYAVRSIIKVCFLSSIQKWIYETLGKSFAGLNSVNCLTVIQFAAFSFAFHAG